MGVLAVSIGALLFTGCGGGSTTTPSVDGSTGKPSSVPGQQLSQCAADYEAAANTMNAALAELRRDTTDNDLMPHSAANNTYATAIQTFNEKIIRLSCPEDVNADIRTLVEAGAVMKSAAILLGQGKMPNTAAMTEANEKISLSVTLIRGSLGLPPQKGSIDR
jgi:hypothetical protein